jgi:hypothetical protein
MTAEEIALLISTAFQSGFSEYLFSKNPHT